MKKLLIVFGCFFTMQACSNNNGESGVVNDGIKMVDSNGGLADTLYTGNEAATDTSKMENREGTAKRDTFEHR